MAIVRNIPDIHLIDKDTKQYLGSWSEDTPEEKLPANSEIVKDVEPPYLPSIWNGRTWVEIQPDYKQLRQAEYAKISIGDQLDAIYKYAMMTPEERDSLVPDKTQPPGTPAGWLGTIQDIKQRYPKDEEK